MNRLVAFTRLAVPASCQARRCSRDGCSISMNGIIGERIIVDMDCKELDIPKCRKRCDFIFIGKGNWVAPIELKRGSLEASEVIEQLKTGAAIAERKFVPDQAKVKFRPLVAYGGKIHKSQYLALQKSQSLIKFNGGNYEAKPIRCGSPLAQVLP